MRIIKIIPNDRRKGSWRAFEAKGVEPSFRSQAHAIDYARGRFGGTKGEIHVYDDADERVLERSRLTEVAGMAKRSTGESCGTPEGRLRVSVE